MPRYEAHTVIERPTVERVTKLCVNAPGRDEVGRDEVVYEWEAKFTDGTVIAVQVCADNEPDNHPCWCQAVLFQTGDSGDLYEVSCTDVEERPWGDWEFKEGGNEYRFKVEPET